MSESCAGAFSRFYFPKFGVAHAFGQLLRDYFNLNDTAPGGAYEDHMANLFAVKYLHHRRDSPYLDELSWWIEQVMSESTKRIPFDIDKLNRNYPQIQSNKRTYMLMQCLSIREAEKSYMSFTDTLSTVTEGHMNCTNPSIIFQRDHCGENLVNECLHLLFSCRNDFPSVKTVPVSSFGVQDLIHQKSE